MPRRCVQRGVRSQAALLMLLVGATACGGPSDGGSAATTVARSSTVPPMATASTSSLAPAGTTAAPTTSTASTQAPGCDLIPSVTLRAGASEAAMDLVHLSRHGDGCGYDADGPAMFDDTFVPAVAVHAPEGRVSVASDEAGAYSLDVRRLEGGPRLASIEPSPGNLMAADDGSYPVVLPASGCLVVTIGIRSDTLDARFTGLAETEVGACQAAVAAASPTIVAVHEQFRYYGPCGNEIADVFGTLYYPLFASELEALDESRYPLEAERPHGFARVAPPGPGDDVGTLIVYSDGMARYESDSGTVDWLTVTPHRYAWEC